MKVGLFQQQSLKVTMTKELSQAISLLQYSALEISDFLQEQAWQNPLIEFQERHSHVSKGRHRAHKSSQAVQPLDIIAAKNETLQQHLLDQLMFLDISSTIKRAVIYIIESLDDDGYLREDLTMVESALNIGMEKVEQALSIIQQMDPAGVGARNLAECLFIQMERNGTCTPLSKAILLEHFEDFAYKKWEKLSKKLHVSIFDIQGVQNDIVALNPRPGLQYESEQQKFVIPDYIVKKENGKLKAIANDKAELSIKMNEQYKTALYNQSSHEVNSYLKEKYREFEWILKGLKNRKHTLDKVMQAILHYQVQFFEKGPAYLQPLTMKDLAESIEVHESTVSRATRNKYVQTPYGMFEMKAFFTNSIQSVYQQELSPSYAKTLIQKMIEQENKRKPLSDQQISKGLQEDYNLVISRRTVAKYREELKILPSTQRKSFT